MNANLGETYAIQPSIPVVANLATVQFRVEESAEALTLTSPKLRVVAEWVRAGTSYLAAGRSLNWSAAVRSA